MKFFRSLSVSLSLSRALKKSSKNAQKDGKKSSLNFLSLSLFCAFVVVLFFLKRAGVLRARILFSQLFFSFFWCKKQPVFG